ncbi:MAG: hypothetical protein IPO90_05965 [Flavobacteriales bacterium]|nr:hypothetical protein [Flavobacteriales bacterium]
MSAAKGHVSRRLQADSPKYSRKLKVEMKASTCTGAWDQEKTVEVR